MKDRTRTPDPRPPSQAATTTPAAVEATSSAGSTKSSASTTTPTRPHNWKVRLMHGIYRGGRAIFFSVLIMLIFGVLSLVYRRLEHAVRAKALVDPDYEWLEPARQFALLNRTIRRPLVILPGMTSTALEAWRRPRCSGLDFRALAWGQVSMISEALRDPVCWLETLTLSSVWRDPPYSYLQPVDGFLTDYFVPGYWLWQKVLRNLGSVGYDRSYIEIIGYDWRLDPLFAQERDDVFGRVTAAIKRLRKKHGEKVVFVAHSLGVLWVHHYFAWMEEQQPGFVEESVDAFVNVGGPLLGVPKSVSSVVSAEMKDTAVMGPLGPRLMELFWSRRLAVRWFRSFGSIASMLPCGWDEVWKRVHDFAPVRILGDTNGEGGENETAGGGTGDLTGGKGKGGGEDDVRPGDTATNEGVVTSGETDSPSGEKKRREVAPAMVTLDGAALRTAAETILARRAEALSRTRKGGGARRHHHYGDAQNSGPGRPRGLEASGGHESESSWLRCPVTGKSYKMTPGGLVESGTGSPALPKGHPPVSATAAVAATPGVRNVQTTPIDGSTNCSSAAEWKEGAGVPPCEAGSGAGAENEDEEEPEPTTRRRRRGGALQQEDDVDGVAVEETAADAIAHVDLETDACGLHGPDEPVVPDAFADIHPLSASVMHVLATMKVATRPRHVAEMFKLIMPHYRSLLDEHWRWAFGAVRNDEARPPVGALAPLPKAPSMRYYCSYGVGSEPETEIGYRYSVNPMGYLSLTTEADEAPVLFGYGDGTVPLASLGYMCAGPWRQKGNPLNPSGLKVIIREYNQSLPGDKEGHTKHPRHRKRPSRWLDRVYTSAAVGGFEGAVLALMDEVEGFTMSVFNHVLYFCALVLSYIPRIPERVVDLIRGASTTAAGHVEILGHRQFIIDLMLIASEPNDSPNCIGADCVGVHIGGSQRPLSVPRHQSLHDMVKDSSEYVKGARRRFLPRGVDISETQDTATNVEGDAAEAGGGGSGGLGSLGGADVGSGMGEESSRGRERGPGDKSGAEAGRGSPGGKAPALQGAEGDVMRDLLLTNVLELSSEIADDIGVDCFEE